MKVLIYGAGTIGLTYAWLLSSKHEVDVLVREQKLKKYQAGFRLFLKDLQKKEQEYQEHLFQPRVVSKIERDYDFIFLTVNSKQLEKAVADLTQAKPSGQILILQNNWDIDRKLAPYFAKEDYLLAFPSAIGGGRKNGRVEAIIFKEATLVDEGRNAEAAKKLFEESRLAIREMPALSDWLKVHCLQEAVMAGAVAEAGSFERVKSSSQAVRKMICAWREGLLLCQEYGISTKRYQPTKYLFLPLFFLVPLVKRMLRQDLVSDMVASHLASGYEEWAEQYQEILASRQEKHFPMPVWQSYQTFVEDYLQKKASP